MADLFRRAEVARFICEWLAEPNGLAHVQHAARDQRRNLEAVKLSRREGRAPAWCDVDEYEECVRMLEEAARG